MNGTPVSFDANNLQTPWIFVDDIDHESMGTKIAVPYIIAHANGSAIPFVEYGSKTVTLSGTIQGTGVSDLDAKLDIFRGYFIGKNKYLDIGYKSGTRRYIATALTNSIKRPGGLAFATFSVTFMCTNPFGQDTVSTTAANATGQTTTPTTFPHTFLGSAPSQYPVISITLVSFTGTGLQTINFGNNANGQQISITRAWAANDAIIIDCIQRTVTVNGTSVDFAGAFTEFVPGPQTMAYSDSFTARNYNISVAYNALYL
jgi:phage-related protein